MPFAKSSEFSQDGVEWCEANIRLPIGSARPGPLRFHRWQREPIRAMLDPAITQVAKVISTQMGKTTMMLAGLGYYIVNVPGKYLIAFPTDDLKDRFWEEKLKDGLPASPAVNDRLLTNSKGTLGQKHIRFTGGGLWPAVSGSEASFSSIDAILTISDEVDRFASLSDSANPLSNIESRGEAFDGREKRWLSSTPGDAERSWIWPELLRGGDARYHVSCPHCGVKQEWVEEQVRDAVMHCGGCGEAWSEEERIWSLDSGPAEWLQNKEAEEGYRGFQISGLYSRRPLAHVMGRCAGDRRAFVCQVLALPYKSTAVDTPDPNLLEGIFTDETIEDPTCIVMTVDVQGRWLEVQITYFDGLFPRTESLTRIQRAVDDGAAWRQVREIWDREKPDITLFDRNKFPGTDVRNNVLRHFVGGDLPEKRLERMNVWFLKGVTTLDNSMITSVSKARREINVNSNECKAGVYRLLQVRSDENGNPLPFGMSANAEGVPADYLRQLTAEECVYRLVNGKERPLWQLRKGQRRNEALDTEAYALVGRAHLGMSYRRKRSLQLNPEVFG